MRTTQDLSHSIPITDKLNWTWAHTFILLQFTLQILLLFPQFGIFRIPMRSASFALGLLLWVLLARKGTEYPATAIALWILAIMLLGFCLHPDINSITAGLVQCAMYAAILSPLFWVKSVNITLKGFESLIFLMWGFHTISAAFGVLQVFYPGKFQPFLSTTVTNSAYGGEDLLITLAGGEQVYRPMGLTDTPGGAATAGMHALLFGVSIGLKLRNPILRIGCVGSAVLGLLCIYLSQVRSILVVTVACIICLTIVLARTGQFGRLTVMTAGTTALFATTFTWATAIGGESTLKRISSLFEISPVDVYQQNRGSFLQSTIEDLLPKYPLGAGLGRWGMINNYFGDNTYLQSQPIWVEIQWTAWLLDGGVPLILAYVAAIAIACHSAWKIAVDRKLGDFALWGGLIFAYNIGALAVTFNYPLFISQSGMEFWLLNAALFTAVCNHKIVDDKAAERLCL